MLVVLEHIRPFTSLSLLELRTITLCHHVHFQIPRLLVHRIVDGPFGQRVTRQRVCIRMQPSIHVCYGLFILHQLHSPPGNPTRQVLLRLEPAESMMIRHNSNWPPPTGFALGTNGISCSAMLHIPSGSFPLANTSTNLQRAFTNFSVSSSSSSGEICFLKSRSSLPETTRLSLWSPSSLLRFRPPLSAS